MNNEWIIRTTGLNIHLWKKNWEKIQDRPLPTCDLYLEFYPYQVDRFMFEYDKYDKRTVTCCLRYKGKKENLQRKLDSVLEKEGFIQKGGYLFNKATQLEKPFVVKRGEHFFDAFVTHESIRKMCSVIDNIIDNILNEACDKV